MIVCTDATVQTRHIPTVITLSRACYYRRYSRCYIAYSYSYYRPDASVTCMCGTQCTNHIRYEGSHSRISYTTACGQNTRACGQNMRARGCACDRMHPSLFGNTFTPQTYNKNILLSRSNITYL